MFYVIYVILLLVQGNIVIQLLFNKNIKIYNNYNIL